MTNGINGSGDVAKKFLYFGFCAFGLAVLLAILIIIPFGGQFIIVGLVSYWVIVITGLIRGKPPLFYDSANLGRNVIISFFVVIAAFLTAYIRHLNTEAKTKSAQHAAQVQEAQKQIFESLNYGAPRAAKNYSSTIMEIDALLTKGDVDLAEQKFNLLSEDMSKYMKMKPIPQEIASLADEYLAVSSDVQESVSISNAVQNFEGQLLASQAQTSNEEVLTAINNLTSYIYIFEHVDAEYAHLIPSNLKNKNFKKIRTQIEKRRKEIQKKIAEAQVLDAVCGPRPSRSEWDGEYSEIERAVKKTAHDPDSIDVENCTPVELYKEGCWVTTCEVRGKNMFGALVLNRMTFSISAIGVSEVKK